MLPISQSEIQQIQSDLEALLDKDCILQRKTRTPDGMGSATETWQTIAQVKAGLGQPNAGELANYDYEIGDKAAWTVRMPIGTDARHQDHLIIDGQTLEVHILLNPTSYEFFHAVIAAEIK